MLLLEQPRRPDIQKTRATWARFVRDGRLDEDALRPHVCRAWRRSAAAGCDPWLMVAHHLPAPATAALLAREQPLVDAARPFLVALSRTAGRERHAAMLSDRNARVLEVMGDGPSLRRPHSAPGPGSLLSEAAAGANGLGSPLADHGYVELIGPEHYIEGFHGVTCQGIPLVGVDGMVVGALGISVRRLAAAHHVRDVLFCASQGVECELLSQWLAGALERAAGGSQVTTGRLRRDIVQRLAAGRVKVDSAARRIASADDAGAVMESAESLLEQLRRQAAVWRDLVSDADEAPVPIALCDLIEDTLGLLTPEMRLNRIRLVWRRAGLVPVVAAHRALTRALLSKLLTAMQFAGARGRIAVEVLRQDSGASRVCIAAATAPPGQGWSDYLDAWPR